MAPSRSRPMRNGHGASRYWCHAEGRSGMYVCGHSSGRSNASTASAASPSHRSLALTTASRSSESNTSTAVMATSTPTRCTKP